MRNSQQPPKYGAEGPPGGVEAWNAQRNAQSQGGKPNMMQRVGGAIAGMNPGWAAQRDAARQTRPDWSQAPRMQWGQQQGAPQGGPPQMPPSGAGPQPGMGIMPMQDPNAAPQMQQPQSPAQQAPAQGQMPQTGMAGLGQAAGKGMAMLAQSRALRGGGRGGMGRTQEY